MLERHCSWFLVGSGTSTTIALHGTKPFAADAGTIAQCTADIEAFALAERRRGETIDKRRASIEVADAAALGLWATQLGPPAANGTTIVTCLDENV